jgi:NAD(P)-dependent dehydrogenase (short-subunit alcohol dehydrogenase family)
MLNRLRGKAIIVIGGGSGIGAGTVRRLASEGANVCVADINEDSAARVASEVREGGGSAFTIHMDIADQASVNSAVEAAAKRLKGLDGAFINAADLRIISSDSDLLAEDLAVFDRTIAVNLRGHFLAARAVLPHLLVRGGGALVFTSSGAADAGDPERPAYAASKSGMHALMRHIASRWGREGITANCVAPGFVITAEATASGLVTQEFLDYALARTKGPRLGQVEDIAAVVAMLLSDEGKWISGQVFHINGGALFR